MIGSADIGALQDRARHLRLAKCGIEHYCHPRDENKALALALIQVCEESEKLELP